MKIQQLLDHHQLARNPFAEEDAQTDPVFKEHCIASTYHPSWDKVYGDPAEPATAMVFGEKGAGKTALRLQIARHLLKYNEQNPQSRVFVIHYDDFNPFLDRFRERLSPRNQRADKALGYWRLWDHMDAILSLGTTGLVDRILGVADPSSAVDAAISARDAEKLDRYQARDLLLLAACYDQSTAETIKGRWERLRKQLKYFSWRTHLDWFGGWAWMVAVAVLVGTLYAYGWQDYLGKFWIWLLVGLAGWAPWLYRAFQSRRRAAGVVRHLRVGHRETGSLGSIFRQFQATDIQEQPLPNKERTDDRYELLSKFQGLLKSLCFTGVIVLVDRVDEPHLINGSAELMKALLWPMLDNKFLKHPGLGLKMMLPVELTPFIDRENRDFYQRARLDKQNMIPSLQWTGEALYDVANARLAACLVDGQKLKLRDLFDASISDERLLTALRALRVPRHLFRFMYQLLMAHCNEHTDDHPTWKITAGTFEKVLATYSRAQDAFDRGLGAG